MKYSIRPLFVIFITLFAFGFLNLALDPVYAQIGGENTVSIQNPLKFGTIPEILNAVAGFLYALALAVVTVMVLWGGFQILTAAGSPERIDRGKKTLLYAVIGTVVILVAGGIADLTADILGGTPGDLGPGGAGLKPGPWP